MLIVCYFGVVDEVVRFNTCTHDTLVEKIFLYVAINELYFILFFQFIAIGMSDIESFSNIFSSQNFISFKKLEYHS